MYIVTGGAGFIGSAFIAELNARGISDILVVDELGHSEKWKNLRGKRVSDYLSKESFIEKVRAGVKFPGVTTVVHMGACSATTEYDVDFLMENNFKYSADLCSYALERKLRFIYASSAATYGEGAQGYNDADAVTPTLHPLNPYGFSKQVMDQWVLNRGLQDRVVGLKFFNVFGPNEAHKGEMRSMVLKAWEQIKSSGRVTLFASHRPDYKDGEQKRDFIYVKDCTRIIWELANTNAVNGIFNVGTGRARSWNDLVLAVFAALGRPPSIEYIEMPPELRSQYQYFTEALMQKLHHALPQLSTRSLEEAITDYVQNHLECGKGF